MKKLLSIMMLIAIASSVNAQVEKNYVYRVFKGKIEYVKQKASDKIYSSGRYGDMVKTMTDAASEQHPEYANEIRTAIFTAVNAGYRLRVIDEKFSLNQIGEYEDALICDGTISSINCSKRIEREKDSKGRIQDKAKYRAGVSCIVNLKDARTSEIIKTITITLSDGEYISYSTAEKAMGNTINKLQEQIAKEINLTWPLYATIIEGNTVKNDKQKEVFIDLGESNGARKGMTFSVYTSTTIAGKVAKKEIGRLRITELMGDEISKCKVTKGGADIKKQIEKGVQLTITSSN